MDVLLIVLKKRKTGDFNIDDLNLFFERIGRKELQVIKEDTKKKRVAIPKKQVEVKVEEVKIEKIVEEPKKVEKDPLSPLSRSQVVDKANEVLANNWYNTIFDLLADKKENIVSKDYSIFGSFGKLYEQIVWVEFSDKDDMYIVVSNLCLVLWWKNIWKELTGFIKNKMWLFNELYIFKYGVNKFLKYKILADLDIEYLLRKIIGKPDNKQIVNDDIIEFCKKINLTKPYIEEKEEEKQEKKESDKESKITKEKAKELLSEKWYNNILDILNKNAIDLRWEKIGNYYFKAFIQELTGLKTDNWKDIEPLQVLAKLLWWKSLEQETVDILNNLWVYSKKGLYNKYTLKAFTWLTLYKTLTSRQIVSKLVWIKIKSTLVKDQIDLLAEKIGLPEKSDLDEEKIKRKHLKIDVSSLDTEKQRSVALKILKREWYNNILDMFIAYRNYSYVWDFTPFESFIDLADKLYLNSKQNNHSICIWDIEMFWEFLWWKSLEEEVSNRFKYDKSKDLIELWESSFYENAKWNISFNSTIAIVLRKKKLKELTVEVLNELFKKIDRKDLIIKQEKKESDTNHIVIPWKLVWKTLEELKPEVFKVLDSLEIRNIFDFINIPKHALLNMDFGVFNNFEVFSYLITRKIVDVETNMIDDFKEISNLLWWKKIEEETVELLKTKLFIHNLEDIHSYDYTQLLSMKIYKNLSVRVIVSRVLDINSRKASLKRQLPLFAEKLGLAKDIKDELAERKEQQKLSPVEKLEQKWIKSIFDLLVLKKYNSFDKDILDIYKELTWEELASTPLLSYDRIDIMIEKLWWKSLIEELKNKLHIEKVYSLAKLWTQVVYMSEDYKQLLLIDLVKVVLKKYTLPFLKEPYFSDFLKIIDKQEFVQESIEEKVQKAKEVLKRERYNNLLDLLIELKYKTEDYRWDFSPFMSFVDLYSNIVQEDANTHHRVRRKQRDKLAWIIWWKNLREELKNRVDLSDLKVDDELRLSQTVYTKEKETLSLRDIIELEINGYLPTRREWLEKRDFGRFMSNVKPKYTIEKIESFTALNIWLETIIKSEIQKLWIETTVDLLAINKSELNSIETKIWVSFAYMVWLYIWEEIISKKLENRHLLKLSQKLGLKPWNNEIIL